MITASGVIVLSENEGCPTLEDIACSLGRAPRWRGSLKGWWTVLQHSIAAERLADARGLSVRTRLFALLHDAHEAVTGDISKHWKPPVMRDYEEDLDDRIRKSLALPAPTFQEKLAVGILDTDLALAEAAIAVVDGAEKFVVERVGRPAPLDALAVVREVYEYSDAVGSTWDPACLCQQLFITQVRLLAGEVKSC